MGWVGGVWGVTVTGGGVKQTSTIGIAFCTSSSSWKQQLRLSDCWACKWCSLARWQDVFISMWLSRTARQPDIQTVRQSSAGRDWGRERERETGQVGWHYADKRAAVREWQRKPIWLGIYHLNRPFFIWQPSIWPREGEGKGEVEVTMDVEGWRSRSLAISLTNWPKCCVIN